MLSPYLGKALLFNVTIFVTYLHETSLMSQFVQVEFNIPFCRIQSVLQTSENQKSILFFHPKLRNFENSEKIKSKSSNNEKMALKKRTI